MISLETMYFLALLFVLVLELVFAVTLFMIKKTFDKERKSYSQLFEATRSHLTEIVSEATEQSKTTVQHTMDTHDRILRDLDHLSTALEKKTELIVQNMSAWEKDTIQTQLTTYSDTLSKETQNSVLTLKATVTDQIQKLDQEIAHTIRDTQQQLKLSMKDAFAASQQEMVKYQQQKIQELESEVNTIVNRVAREVLAKNLDGTDQHELTKNLLQKALQEGEFSDDA